MNYAIIEDGRVANIVIADSPLHGNWIVAPDHAKVGDECVNGEFRPALPSRIAPQSISMRQARLALLKAGLLSRVEAAINAMPSPHKEAALIEWEFATEVKRDAALASDLARSLGLTNEQVDDLFTEGSAL